jgi:hypothetical protein
VKPTLIVYGNCQSQAVAHILRHDPALGGRFRIVHAAGGGLFGDRCDPPADEDLAACMVLLEEFGPRRFAFFEQLPANCRRMRFPAVDINVLWPFAVRNPYNRRDDLHEDGPFPYGDRTISELVESGMSAEPILARYLSTWTSERADLDLLLRLDTARLIARDAVCDVSIGSFVLANFRGTRLFWTLNHPTNALLCELVERIVARCRPFDEAFAQADIAETVRTHCREEVLGALSLPIQAWVARRLSLSWYDANELHHYYDGNRHSYAEYYGMMIRHAVAARSVGGPVSPKFPLTGEVSADFVRGYFSDGWVEKDLSFEIVPGRVVESLWIRGQCSQDLTGPLDVSVSVNGIEVAHSHIEPGREFSLGSACVLARGARAAVSVRSATSINMKRDGKGLDERDLAFLLNRIEVTHPPLP